MLGLALGIAKSTILAHLFGVLNLVLLDQECCPVLEHSAHYTSSSLLGTILLQTKVDLVHHSDQRSRGEALDVLGVMAVQGNLALMIDGPFARLEQRELLLRFGNRAHHVVCRVPVVCRQLGLDFVDIIANRYPSAARDPASGLGLGGGWSEREFWV